MPTLADDANKELPSKERRPRPPWSRTVGGFALAVVGGGIAACLWRPDALAALTLIPAWCWPIAGMLSAFPFARVRTVRELTLLQLFWIIFTLFIVEEVSSVALIALDAAGRSRAAPAFREMRVVSLNCANSAACLGDLQLVAPDIVLLQEAPAAEQLATITRELFGDAGDFVAGGDTAILVRGQIEPRFVDRAVHFVAGTIQLEKGGSFDCISLRLSPPPSRLDFWSPAFWTDHRDLRQRHRDELRQIKNRLKGKWSGNPILIGGDFNCVPLDRTFDELRPQFKDAFASGGRGWGATGTNDWPLFRVDQIWTTQLATFRTRGIATRSSDHRMVVCEIRNF